MKKRVCIFVILTILCGMLPVIAYSQPLEKDFLSLQINLDEYIFVLGQKGVTLPITVEEYLKAVTVSNDYLAAKDKTLKPMVVNWNKKDKDTWEAIIKDEGDRGEEVVYKLIFKKTGNNTVDITEAFLNKQRTKKGSNFYNQIVTNYVLSPICIAKQFN